MSLTYDICQMIGILLQGSERLDPERGALGDLEFSPSKHEVATLILALFGWVGRFSQSWPWAVVEKRSAMLERGCRPLATTNTLTRQVMSSGRASSRELPGFPNESSDFVWKQISTLL